MIKSPRTILAAVLPLAAGVTVGFGLNWTSWAQQGDPLPSVPYTASVVERALNADGTERYRFVKTIARRGDGSIAVQEHRYYKSSEGKPLELPSRYVQDIKSKKLTSIYPQVEGRITSQLTDRVLQRLTSRPASGCADAGFTVDASAGAQTLAGQQVIVRQRQLVSSDNDLGPALKEWVAPGLDCLVMRREVHSVDAKGVLRGSVIVEVANVTRGEPAEELFAIPAGFKEMTPSEVMMAQNRIQGIQCTDCDRKAMENADRYYFANPPLSK